VDLFMWEESTDSITRISDSDEGEIGDTDSCEALDSWIGKCSIQLISESALGEHAMRPNFFTRYSEIPGNRGGNNARDVGSDSFVAAASGDIYFLSPEQLDGPDNGLPGSVNLYVYRNGSPQFVTIIDDEPACIHTMGRGLDGEEKVENTYCGETSIARMQVTPSGSHAAFLSTSRLTAYDNQGTTQMYRYQAETKDMICVSCPPSGDPPVVHFRRIVQGSMNGRYLTDDGRVFFSTWDALVSRDTNDGVDVYEYVDGRPQLITQGTGRSSKIRCDACGLSGFGQPGLLGVSANGAEVYFSTYDVLVPQDRNGGALKVYVARTNGGFPFKPAPAKCAAADECHGPGSLSPPPIAPGTSSPLGGTGNMPADSRCTKLSKQAARAMKRGKRQQRKAKRTPGSKQAKRQLRRASVTKKQGKRLRKRARSCRRANGGNR